MCQGYEMSSCVAWHGIAPLQRERFCRRQLTEFCTDSPPIGARTALLDGAMAES